MRNKIFILMVLVSLIGLVCALDDWREQRLEFGHVIFIDGINTEPSTIVPGKPAVLKIEIENTGSKNVEDLRFELGLTDELGFFNDISTRKISRLRMGEKKGVEFNLIALPGSSEGVYNAVLTVDYVNHVGDERQDNYTISLIVKSTPKIFAQVESTTIYNKNSIGEVTVKFVNNDLGNIKFFTVEIQDSEDYEVISPKKEYIGDIDSDDFESVDFRLKAKKKKGEIKIPLRVSYKDSLNNDVSEDMEVVLNIRSAGELGIETNGTTQIVIIVIISIVIGYYFYRKWRKKRKREQKF